MQKRIVVTGIGMITPFGDTRQTWEAVAAGRSAIAPLPEEFHLCPTQIGGIIPPLQLETWFEQKTAGRIASRSMRTSQFAQVAAQQALEGTGLLGEDGALVPHLCKRTGVAMGTGVGASELIAKMALDMNYANNAETEEQKQARMQQLIKNHLGTAMIGLPDASAFQTSLTFGLKGPMDCSIKACATGAANIRRAAMEILLGHADIMVAGGTESLYPVDMMPFNIYARRGALSRRNDDPQGASRPFDQEHDGFVAAEGAGALVLETLESARSRNVPILAELAGYGETSDAMGATDPAQESQQEAMNMALDMAGPDPQGTLLIKTHGTSTITGDKSEASAITTVINTPKKASQVFAWAVKSELGHTLGASGGIETALSIMAMRQGIVPPTRNLINPIPEAKHLTIPRNATKENITTVLCNAFGFGGQNVCLAFKK